MIGEMTTVDLTPLMPILENFQGRKRDALIPLLHEAQAIYGWLPREVQVEIGKTLRVPLADIHGVIEFFTMFYNEPTGRNVIRVCEDLACQLAGAGKVKDALAQELNLGHGQTDEAADITLEYVPCLGLCDKAPAALNGKYAVGHLTATDISKMFNNTILETESVVGGEPKLILGSIGKNDPGNLSSYEMTGGYSTLRRLIDMEPEEIIQQVEESGILGRGGAMFPLGRKWRFTRGTPTPVKHIVVNADESEPGTFKDRVLMEGDPFSLLEATTIAGYAVGAENGWIFIRGEYPQSYSSLKEAIRQARDAGYLGQDIFGKQGFNFDIELRLSAGAYICGEETALFEAIEGKRGFPRIKPPFPTTNGLFNQPTAINNVETLVATLAALKHGIENWREYGTEQSPGTKLFCLSGHVLHPGVYEVPFGKTIRELIMLAGGVPGNREIQGVLVGGAAGVFVGPDMIDMRLTYEDSRSNEVPLGSGVIMVFDEDTDMRPILRQIGHFFAHESCGKCFPCQLGTQRQLEILDRITMNGSKPSDRQALTDIGLTMAQTSLCGLGQTASIAIKSAMKLWPEIVE